MRLRLVHTLSLLLLSAVLLSVLAMGGVMAWNLKDGFSDYLQSREVERLEQFAALVAEAAEEAGGADALTRRRLDMRQLLHRFAQRQGLVPAGAPVPPRPPRGPPRDGSPPGGADGFGGRVAVVDLDGRPLIGRPLPPDAARYIDRPIRLRGEVVALARMLPGPAVPDPVESRFLRTQYIGIFAVAGALVLLALAGAWWLAGRWVRPLLAVQDATARIARGEFGVRLEEGSGMQGRSDEFGDVVRNVNRMAEGLQRLEGARRRWLADISHELRTPLAVLRGEIEALVDGVRPLHREAMLSLREEAFRLGALVDDLHLLAMSDLQALPCHFAEADAAQSVQQLVQRFAARAATAGLTLDIHADSVATLPVRWDSARIDQLLGNLLENSLRYTDAPGRVQLQLQRDGNRALIDIDDSAPGVLAADLPRLFEPLYRADVARSRLNNGSGLGLAICDAIVRSHGGRIDAAVSALGGLCVHIELPLSAGAP